MKDRTEQYLPLIVTVGQVAIFPYYILWLKEVSLTFPLFAWLFSVFSFAAAWGYQVFQKKKSQGHFSISFVYAGMGCVYILAGNIKHSLELLPYAALLLQISLGFMQGYFRAWHIKQKSYHLHAVHHYLIVGVTMLGLSFVKIISPAAFITAFGIMLCMSGFWDFMNKRVC